MGELPAPQAIETLSGTELGQLLRPSSQRAEPSPLLGPSANWWAVGEHTDDDDSVDGYDMDVEMAGILAIQAGET